MKTFPGMLVAAAMLDLVEVSGGMPRKRSTKPRPAEPTEPDGMSRQRRRYLERKGLLHPSQDRPIARRLNEESEDDHVG